MEKSDLEDGEVTSSDAEEILPSKPTAVKSENDVIVISSDGTPPVQAGVIDITSGDVSKSAPTSTVAKKIATAAIGRGTAGGDAVGSDAEDSLSRTAQKRRNRKQRKKMEEHAKKAKTDAQIKQLEAAEMDEYEMLCVRGASPPRSGISGGGLGAGRFGANYTDDDSNSDDDDDSNDPSSAYYRSTAAERRERRRKRSAVSSSTGRHRRQRRNSSTDDQASGRDNSEYRAPRKLELCKFFLTGKCAKSNHCTYLHEDFPCKFYYLGIPHKEDECMFAHGAPLEPAWQGALLKHIERAPQQILGKFPKAYKQNAAKMMRATHDRMVAAAATATAAATEPKGGSSTGTAGAVSATATATNESFSENTDEKINSAANGTASLSHHHVRQHQHHHHQHNNSSNNRHQQNTRGMSAIEPTDMSGRWSPSGKLRAIVEPLPMPPVAQPTDESGRWSPSGKLRATDAVPIAATIRTATPPIAKKTTTETTAPSMPAGRRIDFMADIVNADQLGRLRQLGVEYLAQVNNLTVAQLNDIGLSIAQIHQIQMCSLNAAPVTSMVSTPVQSLVAAPVTSVPKKNVGVANDLNGDVDMRIPAMAVASTMPAYVAAAAAAAAAAVAAPAAQAGGYALPIGRPLVTAQTHDESDNDEDDGDDDDDDDTDGQLVINDDDISADDPDGNA